ncbi:MAG: phosphodiester glycosidase family protein [Armatimonas sp.]
MASVDIRLPLDGTEADTSLHPRVAAAILLGNKLLFLVVDGRQPGYSEGISMTEIAELFRERGAVAAINLDGGGSATLVMADTEKRPQLLNSPIDNKIPGRERPVANHLGIFATPLERHQ